MNFQDLHHIENSQFYLDLALRKAEEKARLLRQSIKLKSVSRIIKSKRIEIEKLRVLREVLNEKLGDIHLKFPSIDNLPEFYNQLIKINLDVDMLRKSLGSVAWARTNITKFSKMYTIKIKGSNDQGEVSKLGSAALGRISSIMRQIDKFLTIIEAARKKMRNFPAVKTSLFTISIAGFPNVGKSTLLKKITSSDPEIASYAFTTKQLNTGYSLQNNVKLQFIDTPGTLARFEKMNPIERQAILAMKYASEMIIYIYDLSETYSMADQDRLLELIEDIDKPIIIYLSKIDIVDKSRVDEFIKNFPKEHKVCLTDKELFDEILKVEKNVYEE